MPSPVRFDQKTILNAAFQIVRTQGLQSLSARQIAQRLGCSTQPIYSVFGSMKKLREAVEHKAYALFIDYLLKDPIENEPFLSIGLRYLRFAREEQVLFKLFFLEGEMALTREEIRQLGPALSERMKQDPALQKLSDEQLDRIGGDMWVYTHGLAALTFRSKDPDIEVYFREKIDRLGKTIIEWEHGRTGKI